MFLNRAANVCCRRLRGRAQIAGDAGWGHEEDEAQGEWARMREDHEQYGACHTVISSETQ